NLNLQAIRAGLGAKPPPGLEESINAVAEAIRQTRDFSLDLRPSILDDLGLGPALRWYAERLRGRAALAVQLATHLPAEPLAAHVETACFRIVQEALTNVVRHARAHRVHIVAIREGTEVHLSVRDDGVGFDAAAPVEGLGLFGMRDRARLVGGRLVVESSPGRGTLIRAEISTAPAPAPERS